jgi:O-acetyl-ADP-ribose deacetylase (regulator of RNase III)
VNKAIMIGLSDYRALIKLNEPFVNVALEMQQLDCLNVVLSFLTNGKYDSHARTEDKRTLLQSLLTTRAPEPKIPDHIHILIDSLLATELKQKKITDAVALTSSCYSIGSNKIALWKGDITTLRADAIVNAANAQMVGCFLPLHRCIDNAIHSASGPRLREDCHTILQAQGANGLTGEAKITRAYNLPSKFVIHTVGPIVANKLPTANDEHLLAKCYTSCLQLAKDSGSIKSIVFCCISTGVFGYPIDSAAEIAINTVGNWVAENQDPLDLIVFNVFRDRDEDVYKKILQKWN